MGINPITLQSTKPRFNSTISAIGCTLLSIPGRTKHSLYDSLQREIRHRSRCFLANSKKNTMLKLLYFSSVQYHGSTLHSTAPDSNFETENTETRILLSTYYKLQEGIFYNLQTISASRSSNRQTIVVKLYINIIHNVYSLCFQIFSSMFIQKLLISGSDCSPSHGTTYLNTTLLAFPSIWVDERSITTTADHLVEFFGSEL